MRELVNNTTHDHVVAYPATSVTETIEFQTSRFRYYNGGLVWKPLSPNALAHNQNVIYTLGQHDYLNLMRTINTFSNARYDLLVPEYALSVECSYVNNSITFKTVPWVVEGEVLLVSKDRSYAFVVNSTHVDKDKTTITPTIPPPNGTGEGTGLLIPLRLGAVLNSATLNTNLKGATGGVTFQFYKPRNYTDNAYSSDDFPLPKGVINRTVSLPDFEFRGARVRGRVGAGARKDNFYQASYLGNTLSHKDYIIKSVIARALVNATRIELYNDNNNLFPAAISNDVITAAYNRLGYEIQVEYEI